MGHGAWGMGHGAWGMGHEKDFLVPNPQSPIPNAQCPMPNAQCPIPNAQSPIPNPWSLSGAEVQSLFKVWNKLPLCYMKIWYRNKSLSRVVDIMKADFGMFSKVQLKY
jgi:hypothetical protein